MSQHGLGGRPPNRGCHRHRGGADRPDGFVVERLLAVREARRWKKPLAISDFVPREADELALVAIQVSGTASRAEDLNGILARVFAERARLARIAEICTQLSFYGAGFGAERGAACADGRGPRRRQRSWPKRSERARDHAPAAADTR